MNVYPYKTQVQTVMTSMSLHNYIIRRSYDGVIFVKFNCNFNFVLVDSLADVVANSESHRYQKSFRMNFVYDGITNSLIGQ